MKPTYLLDSDVFSLMVKGKDASISRRMQSLSRGEAALSVITVGEFSYGIEHAPVSELTRTRAQRLIEFFGVLPLEVAVAAAYGRIRADLRARGLPIGPNDLWLAAHASAANLVLVSRNTREFSRVTGLTIEDWLT